MKKLARWNRIRIGDRQRITGEFRHLISRYLCLLEDPTSDFVLNDGNNLYRRIKLLDFFSRQFCNSRFSKVEKSKIYNYAKFSTAFFPHFDLVLEFPKHQKTVQYSVEFQQKLTLGLKDLAIKVKALCVLRYQKV